MPAQGGEEKYMALSTAAVPAPGTEKKEMALALRSGCAGAGVREKKRWHSHFAAAGLARGLRMEPITHTSQRLCRRRGAKTKTWHSHYAAVAPAQGAREKKETTLTLHSGCDGAGGGWKAEMAITLRSDRAVAGEVGKKR